MCLTAMASFNSSPSTAVMNFMHHFLECRLPRRLFQRLMSPEGPNLRRYYLPGLEHLKLELSCLELLLSSHQPQLHQHLLDAGLPALLYAAQWLMTTYACPFPVHVRGSVCWSAWLVLV
jgi:hypothetical protein